MSRIGKTHVNWTAGAIPVKNDKGQIAMEKVKVHRYVAGKRPDFAEGGGSSGTESSDEDNREKDRSFVKPHSKAPGEIKKEPSTASEDVESEITPKIDLNDPRFRRLMKSRVSAEDDEESEDRHGRRHIAEPEIIRRSSHRRRSTSSSSSSEGEGQEEQQQRSRASPEISRRRRGDASDEEDEVDEEALERKRAFLRMRAKEREREEELLAQQEESEKESGAEDEESEYEEYSESEDETAPRLKPVFVRKKDRMTLLETEKEEQRLQQLQLEQKKVKEEQKRQTIRLVETLVKQEVETEKKKEDDDRLNLDAVNTDDENEELAYETWKLRELKRIKRDKEEKEQYEREKAELERIHNMSEEERRAYLRANPKVIVNKAQKGKYKFLQKYYHRGVFFLDKDDEVFKRNFAEPTLEDQFDKSVLPKVMQVKDFGKAGRTKWTHLVAEDTTDFQAAWNADTQQNIKFHQKHAAGVKDVFERPAASKKRRKQ